MTLSFEPREEVRLARSPLREVIFQVRFLPILKIGSDEPVAFQEAVRANFPLYSKERAISINIPELSGEEQAGLGPQVHRFISRERTSLISLSSDFLAVSTLAYGTWDEFKKLVDVGLNALLSVYGDIDVSRIGLRYVNAIEHQFYGFSSWNNALQLFTDDLTAPVASSALDSAASSFAVQIELIGFRNTTLVLNLGLNQEKNAVILDLDSFQEYPDVIGTMGSGTILGNLEEHHDQIYRAFRWSIPDEQLLLFEPVGEIR